MDVREKLVELIGRCAVEESITIEPVAESRLVSFLVNHGVTVHEWISVEERLPEESGMYIVTANDGHAQRVSFVQWQKKNRMWNLTGARSYWRVTHWQPMPQPPKGE